MGTAYCICVVWDFSFLQLRTLMEVGGWGYDVILLNSRILILFTMNELPVSWCAVDGGQYSDVAVCKSHEEQAATLPRGKSRRGPNHPAPRTPHTGCVWPGCDPAQLPGSCGNMPRLRPGRGHGWCRCRPSESDPCCDMDDAATEYTMAIFQLNLDFRSLFALVPCILPGQSKSFHIILSNTIPPCLSWAFPLSNSIYLHRCTSFDPIFTLVA